MATSARQIYRQRVAVRLKCTLGAFMVGCSLAGCGSGLKTGDVALGVSSSNPGVVAPSSTPYGKTYGEWSVEWWKWALAIPLRDNPFVDPTGEKSGVGQLGPVWFLSAPIGGAAARACTMPAGKAILFPIVAGAYWIPTDAETPQGIRAVAKDALDHVTELEANVDGVPLQGLRNYRFVSPSTFFFTGPPDAADGVYPGQSGTHEAFADGYWIMLEPLSPGPHTLGWRGKVVSPATFPEVQVFETSVTYHLTVQ